MWSGTEAPHLRERGTAPVGIRPGPLLSRGGRSGAGPADPADAGRSCHTAPMAPAAPPGAARSPSRDRGETIPGFDVVLSPRSPPRMDGDRCPAIRPSVGSDPSVAGSKAVPGLAIRGRLRARVVSPCEGVSQRISPARAGKGPRPACVRVGRDHPPSLRCRPTRGRSPSRGPAWSRRLRHGARQHARARGPVAGDRASPAAMRNLPRSGRPRDSTRIPCPRPACDVAAAQATPAMGATPTHRAHLDVFPPHLPPPTAVRCPRPSTGRRCRKTDPSTGPATLAQPSSASVATTTGVEPTPTLPA